MADSPSSPSDTSLADSPSVSDSNIIPPEQPATDLDNQPTYVNLADSQPATESANTQATPDTLLAESPPTAPTDQPVASPSASFADLEPPAKSESPGQPPTDQSPPEPSNPSPTSVPSPPSEPVSGTSIQDISPPDQPSQVQPEAPGNASSPTTSPEPKTAPESAGIKPEASEGTQNDPLADSQAEKTAKTTFGDLVGEPPAASAPTPTPSSLPISPIPPISPSPSTPSQPEVIEARADFSLKRQRALEVRRKNRADHLAKVLTLVSQKAKINNQQVVDLLRVSQSTATNYLHSLVKDGKLNKEGKGKATRYHI